MNRDLNILVAAVGLSALGDWLALVPRVAGEARLAVANGRVETARYIGFTVGPVVGGLLAGAGGLEIAMVVSAATFLVVAAAAAVVRCPEADFFAGAMHMTAGLVVIVVSRRRLFEPAVSGAPA